MIKKHCEEFLFLLSLVLLYGCGPGSSVIEIKSAGFIYEIGSEGRNLRFIDRSTGADYLFSDTVSYAASVIKDGKKYNPAAIVRKGNILRYDFGEGGTAEIKLKRARGGIEFRVVSVSDDIESVNFINVPLTLTGLPYDPFAACVLSMNMFTHVEQLPALQTHLWASAYRRLDMEGARAAVIGSAPGKMLPAIRTVMKRSDLPFSDKGGAWAALQKGGYGSYLMNTGGRLTEDTVDEWIEMCRSLGFNQIDNHGGGSFFRFGDFYLDPKKWPDGLASMRRINDKLHAAGISSIFHTYAFFIDRNAKYVTPVPSEDLAWYRYFTLAEPVSAVDTEITVNESTAGMNTITGYRIRNSATLRIGKELITFGGVTDTPPYRFTNCIRGAQGTKISSHNSGEKMYHIKQLWGGLLAPGGETELFREIARRTAEIVDSCAFDGIYLDAIDGSDLPGGMENYWYFGTKFITEIAKNLKTPVGMEMAGMTHHWWHYRSRWQAWDKAVRGYKKFIDIHIASLKSQTHQHGEYNRNTPEINRLAAAEGSGVMLPLQLGWWSNQTWDPPDVEMTYIDDIEYLCCKMIGNNAGVAMIGGADKQTLNAYPQYTRLIPVIKQYEELRHARYFSDSVKSLLRQPGKDFSLIKTSEGIWKLKPVNYHKHTVTGVSDGSSEWKVNNEFRPQPLKLRIEPLMGVKPYNDPAAIVLADYRRNDEFSEKQIAKGVKGNTAVSSERSVTGEHSLSFTALSNGESPQTGSYLSMQKTFDPLIDLSGNKAIGLWIKGDGSGSLLNINLEAPEHISKTRGDHYINVDFKGWKYFELVEIESSEFSDYLWPDTYTYIYLSYNGRLQFRNIGSLNLWYNNLPAGKEVNCLIGPVKALPIVSLHIKDPVLKIGDKEIVFPVEMESGMYLELISSGDCRLYGTKGEFLQDVQINQDVPELKNGENEFSFRCVGQKGINTRVKMTVITEGKPL
jgi:hypothetical protein